MPNIDYIQIAKALENNEPLNLPEAEQGNFEQIWETAEQYTTGFDTSAGFAKLNAIIDGEKTSKKSGSIKWFAAASILIALIISMFTYLNKELESYATLKGETLKVELADKSQIVLQGASELKLDPKFNDKNRLVCLEGIAKFDIAKDKTKPFVIHTEKGDVTVVGTSFTVYADDETDRFALDVYEGKVKVNTPEEEKYLTKGMHLELDEDGLALISKENNDQQAASNFFNFNNTKVKDVIKEIENKFGVSVLYDSKMAKERITLKTKADNAESLLLIISETLGSEFKTQ